MLGIRRLYRKEFLSRKSTFTMLGWKITKSNKYKVYMKTKGSDECKMVYTYYLTDEEVEKFKASEYIKSHKQIEGSYLDMVEGV